MADSDFITEAQTVSFRNALAAAHNSLKALVAGKQNSDVKLTAIAGVTAVADRLAYFTGATTVAVTPLTAAGRNLIDDASTSAQRTTLGLGTAATTASTAYATSAQGALASSAVQPAALTAAIVAERANSYGIVIGGANAATARPTLGYAGYIWFMSVQPTNAVSPDFVVRTDEAV